MLRCTIPGGGETGLRISAPDRQRKAERRVQQDLFGTGLPLQDGFQLFLGQRDGKDGLLQWSGVSVQDVGYQAGFQLRGGGKGVEKPLAARIGGRGFRAHNEGMLYSIFKYTFFLRERQQPFFSSNGCPVLYFGTK